MQSEDKEITVVTACDKKFLWGAFLLLASLRKAGMLVPVHVLVKNFSTHDKDLLLQFPPIKIIDLDTKDLRNLITQKPFAILSAYTNLITWMDADCIVTGNLTELILKTGKTIQLRFRSKQENKILYKNPNGFIPKDILNQWKLDVDDLEQSRISTAMSTCCFTINKEYLPFIELWQGQIDKVLPSYYTPVVLESSRAYSMMDEAVLNSLLAFSSIAPPTSEYLLDKDVEKCLVHFVSRPKPWQMWRLEHLKWYETTLDIIEWAIKNKLKTPPIGWSLKRKNKFFSILIANLRFLVSRFKSLVFNHAKQVKD